MKNFLRRGDAMTTNRPRHSPRRSAASSRRSASRTRRTNFISGPRSTRRSASARSCASKARCRSTGRFREIYGIVVEGFSYTDLQTPLHDVLGHDGTPGGGVARGDRARGDPAVHGGRAASVPRRAAAAGADGRGLSRRRQRRRGRAANGRLPQGRIAHGHSDRRVSRRRHRRADLPRCGFSHRARSGASQHHRRLRTRHEDERDRVDPVARSSRTFPEQKGSVAAVCFNVKGPDLCFLDQPGDIDDGGSRALREVRRPARAIRERSVLRAVQVRRHSRSTRCARTKRCCTTCRRSRGDCAKCCSTPKSCSTRTTSTPRPTR